VPPKKYFPQIFFLEIGGGSKHVLGRGRQSEGITCFLKKNSPLDLGKYFEKKMFFWKIAKNLPLHLESLGWTRSTAVVAENKRTSDVVVLALFLGAVLAVKVGVIRQISENRHRGQISGLKGHRSKWKCVCGCRGQLALCQTGSPGERWPDCEHAECGAVEKAPTVFFVRWRPLHGNRLFFRF